LEIGNNENSFFKPVEYNEKNLKRKRAETAQETETD